jgi:phage terminase small subunit
LAKTVKKLGKKPKKEDRLSGKEEAALCIFVEQGMYDMKGACIKAGYSPKSAHVTANLLKKKQKAIDYLSTKTTTVLKKYHKTSDDVLNEAALIAFSDIKDLFEDTESGPVLKSVFKMGDTRRAIKAIKHTQKVMYLNPEDETAGKIVENKYEYQLWSKDTALRLLAEYHGVTTPKPGDNIVTPLVYLPDNSTDAEYEVVE